MFSHDTTKGVHAIMIEALLPSQVAGGVSGQHQTAAEGHKMLLGNACLLANTLAMAIYFITAKQLVLKYPPMCVAAWAYIIAAVCMGIAAVAYVDQKDWSLPSIMLGPLAYWVVVCSVIGYYVVTWATQYLPASQVFELYHALHAIHCKPVMSYGMGKMQAGQCIHCYMYVCCLSIQPVKARGLGMLH